MDEKLKEDIEAMVASIFNSKEKEDQVKKTEETLTKAAATISDLTNAMEAKNVEIEDLKSGLDNASTQVASLTSELEAVRAKNADLEKEILSKKIELEAAAKSLEDIRKDKVAETRMNEITEAGVARSDTAGQFSKVREMSDEDFASYKAELVEVKTSIEAELNKKSEIEKIAAEKASADKAAADKADADKAAADKAAETAALNFETASAETISVKYKQLGQALADVFKVKKD